MDRHSPSKLFRGLVVIIASSFLSSANVAAADAYQPFIGEKSSWHDGFDRYDFVMDEEKLKIEPFERAQDERSGVKDPPKENAAASWSFPRSRARATRGPGAAVTGTTSPRPKSSCSSADFTSPTSRPTPLETRQGRGTPGMLPHRETRAFQEAGLHRHEPGRGIRVQLGHRQSRQGFVHLRRQSRESTPKCS